MKHLLWESENRNRVKAISISIIILLDILIGLVVLQQIKENNNYPFDRDEGIHALSGLELTNDLLNGDIGAFLVDSYQQDHYPPAFSWFESIAFLFFGASAYVARACSLFCLIASTPFLYAIGLELDDRNGWLVGLIAVALTLTSQVMLVYSGMVMLEMPGLLVSCAALWVYLRAAKRSSSSMYLIASLLMMLAFLVKYPYGLLIIATILLSEALSVLIDVERKKKPWKDLAKRWLWLFGPLILLIVVWFVAPYKRDHFIKYINAQPKQLDLFSLENLIFYPRSLAYHYLPSPLFGIIGAAALVWGFFRWRNFKIRLMLIFFTIGLAAMTFELQNQPRFIATIVPALYLLIGAMFAFWFSQRPTLTISAQWIRRLISVGILLCCAASLPMLAERFAVLPALYDVEYETHPSTVDMMAWIQSQVPPESELFMINSWDQFNARAMTWYMAVRSPNPIQHLLDNVIEHIGLKGPAWKKASHLKEAIYDSGADYIVAIEGGDGGEQRWPEYESYLVDEEKWLEPIATRDFTTVYYDMNRWLKNHYVTRDELENAKALRCHPFTVRISVYRLAES